MCMACAQHVHSIWHSVWYCMHLLTPFPSVLKSGGAFTTSEAYRQRIAHVVHLSGDGPFQGYSEDAFAEAEREEEAERHELRFAIKAVDLDGAHLLGVLAAAHAEAPRRVGLEHVDDGGGVGQYLRGTPLSVVCATKPHLRSKLIDAQFKGQHRRVEEMLRFSTDVKSQMDNLQEKGCVYAPRVVVRNLPMPVPLLLFKAVRAPGVIHAWCGHGACEVHGRYMIGMRMVR